MRGGTVIILHPGEWHRYRPDSETGWSEAYIGIGGEFLEHMFAEPFFRRPPTIIQLQPDGPFDLDLVALVDEIQAHRSQWKLASGQLHTFQSSFTSGLALRQYTSVGDEAPASTE